jgi:Fe-S cluster assembly protein SufD
MRDAATQWLLAPGGQMQRGACAPVRRRRERVQVRRAAQRTDAAQLSRNLLLVPKATVNVKPNLQIVADDVKCTHGCTVSDLSEDEMFYFRSRGIGPDAARAALVYSFGAEVVQQLRHEELVARLQAAISAKLAEAPL